MATALGLEEIRAHALDNVGSARVSLGDIGGLEDLEQSVQISDEIGSIESLRGYNNLFASRWGAAMLDRAAEAVTVGLQVAGRFGAPAAARWLLFERVPVAYWSGQWDEALQMLEETLADVGPAHALSRWALEIRGRVRLAGGALSAARDDAQRSLALARDAKDPQTLCPALSFAAVTLLEAGQDPAAALLADELLALDVASRRVSTPVSPLFDLAWILAALGRSTELIEAAEQSRVPSPWTEAAVEIARGNYLPAADIYGEIGHLPNEAYTRLRAAEQLVAEGRRAEADEQLEKAIAFFRGVGAKRYVREGEALFAASA